MAVYIGSNDVSFERTGVRANVSNNDIARLMYYLNCACNAIDLDNDPEIQRFTNYDNWVRLSINEQKALLVACASLSPDILNNRVFFHSNELCGDFSNQFYTINQVRNQVLASESIIIAGRQRVVNKVMTYKMVWMETNYLNPMRRLVERFNTPSITHTTPTYRQPSSAVQPNRTRNKRSCCCKCCVISIVVLILMVGVGIVVYFILKQRRII